MKVIYVAGPFRGKDAWTVENNIRRAESLALEIWRFGAAAICPHANTRFFDGAAPDKQFLEGDLEILNRCDAVLLTPDWERGEGARGERAAALVAHIPVFDDLESLRRWLKDS
jgi:nucleoside 2-deoxyribosyltransferase